MFTKKLKLTFSCFLILLTGFTTSYADNLFKPTDFSQAKKLPEGFSGILLASTSDYLVDCCPDKPESFCYTIKIANKSKELETYTAQFTYQQGKCPVKEVANPIGSDGLVFPPTCPEPLKYTFVQSTNLGSIQIEPNTNKIFAIPMYLAGTSTVSNTTKNESIVIKGHGGLFSESIKIKNFKADNNINKICFANSNGR